MLRMTVDFARHVTGQTRIAAARDLRNANYISRNVRNSGARHAGSFARLFSYAWVRFHREFRLNNPSGIMFPPLSRPALPVYDVFNFTFPALADEFLFSLSLCPSTFRSANVSMTVPDRIMQTAALAKRPRKRVQPVTTWDPAKQPSANLTGVVLL